MVFRNSAFTGFGPDDLFNTPKNSWVLGVGSNCRKPYRGLRFGFLEDSGFDGSWRSSAKTSAGLRLPSNAGRRVAGEYTELLGSFDCDRNCGLTVASVAILAPHAPNRHDAGCRSAGADRVAGEVSFMKHGTLRIAWSALVAESDRIDRRYADTS